MYPRSMFAPACVVLYLALSAAAGAGEYRWDLPPGVSPPRIPDGAVMSAERVELGRYLFYDTRLSVNDTKACASCHLQELAFTDGRAHPIGATGELHPRSAMSLINAAYRDALTWANPTLRKLEDQVLVPIFGTHPIELGLLDHQEDVYRELAKDTLYRRLFAAAFPGTEAPGTTPPVAGPDSTNPHAATPRTAASHPTAARITTPNVAAALAAFVRSIVSFRSPFDRYRFDGDTQALTPAARRGMQLFFSSRARCGGCHMAQNVTVDLGLNLDGGSKTAASPPADPAVFMFHNTGLYDLPAPFFYPADNRGLYAVTGDLKDVGKFRVPTLRNIAVTAPYMHDGSIPTLDKVLEHYTAGGRAPNQLLSESIHPLDLTADERRDVIAFLESLTDAEALVDPRWSDPWK